MHLNALNARQRKACLNEIFKINKAEDQESETSEDENRLLDPRK